MPPSTKTPLVLGIVATVLSLPGFAAGLWLIMLATIVAGDDCNKGDYSFGDTTIYWLPAVLLVLMTAACVTVTLRWRRPSARWLSIVLLVAAIATSLLGMVWGVLGVFGTDSC